MVEFKDIKNWSPDIEKQITSKWKSLERYNFDVKTKKKIYSIDTPPPYVNSPVHIAQAITYCFMDMFARFRRMRGYEVIFPLGLDRNGLPIELAAERKYNISPFEIGREKFLEYCKKLIDEGSEGTKESFAQLGISFTSYKEGKHIGAVYLTDSPEYRALTQSTFIDLYKKGLIYEDSRINNWDPALRTTISDSEIEYIDIPSTFNDIKWKIKGSKEEIIIATTRPELICTCGMVIFNPEDKRYKHLNGKTAISPIFEKEVPIKAHPLADPEKGSGVVMMCSAGDLSDIQFFREQKLKPVIAINQNGTMNENAGFLKGLKIKDARKKIIDELKSRKLLIKQQQITHRTPISDRSKAEIEFIEMPEFYLRQLNVKEDIKKISKKLNFYPETSRKILEDWIDSINIDWPISRRRYSATEVPLWSALDNDGTKIYAIPKSGKYYQPWKENAPANAEVWKNGKSTGKNVSQFKNLKWEGEERVLDTWMDSSISELFILKYKEDNAFFKKSYPASVRPQGKEIVRTWLYYTILRGYLETGKLCFKDAWIHQHLLDEKGKKMSKSLGNVIDPKEIVKKSGAEAIRIWAAIEGDLSKQDLSVSPSKIDSELKTLNKIINVSKFTMLFEKPKKKPKITALDNLFIEYIENLTNESCKCYENYDFYHPALQLRNFLWEIFASHYIELVKARAYNSENKFTKEESDSARYTLHFLLERFLTLIYPIIPQITSVIAKEKGIDLLNCDWPKTSLSRCDLILIEKLMEFNSLVWKTKKENGKGLRDEISGIQIPKELKDFEKDLRIAHNLK